jgi:hypothetical protein
MSVKTWAYLDIEMGYNDVDRHVQKLCSVLRTVYGESSTNHKEENTRNQNVLICRMHRKVLIAISKAVVDPHTKNAMMICMECKSSFTSTGRARSITHESQKGDVPIAIPKAAVDPHILAWPERSFLRDLLNESALSMT